MDHTVINLFISSTIGGVVIALAAFLARFLKSVDKLERSINDLTASVFSMQAVQGIQNERLAQARADILQLKDSPRCTYPACPYDDGRIK